MQRSVLVFNSYKERYDVRWMFRTLHLLKKGLIVPGLSLLYRRADRQIKNSVGSSYFVWSQPYWHSTLTIVWNTKKERIHEIVRRMFSMKSGMIKHDRFEVINRPLPFALNAALDEKVLLCHENCNLIINLQWRMIILLPFPWNFRNRGRR